VYFTISSFLPEEGFLVSNREGGNALKNSTCCVDIYYYKQTQYIRVKLKGNISNTDNPATTIADATIEVYVKDKVTKEKVWIKNITSDSLGNFEILVSAGDSILISKEEYQTKTFSVEASTEFIIEKKFQWHDLINPQFYIEYGGLWLLLFVIFAETGLFAGFFLPGDSLLFVAGIYSRDLASQVIPFSNEYVDLIILWIIILSQISNLGLEKNLVPLWHC
jgi:hypothetical protein